MHVPAPELEAVRDLARARTDLDDDLNRVRRRLLSFLLRHGYVYRAGTTWTQAHHQWLDALRLAERAEQQTFEYYRSVMAISEQELAAITPTRSGPMNDALAQPEVTAPFGAYVDAGAQARSLPVLKDERPLRPVRMGQVQLDLVSTPTRAFQDDPLSR